MRIWIIAALFLTTSMAVAEGPFDPIFDHLANAPRFAMGPGGVAASISPLEKDYRAILARPSALADLERLFKSGNLQAKCYALIGIRALSPETYKKLAESLRRSTDKVATIGGCIATEETMAEMIKRFDAGMYP